MAVKFTHRLPIISGLIIVALVLLAVFWDWNWFKPIVESKATETLGRQVTIRNIDLHLFRRTPVFEADDVQVANPAGFKAESRFGSIGKLAVAIQPSGLFHHQVNLSSVEIDNPKGDLGPGPDGKPNWLFPALMKKPDQPPSAWSTNIGALVVRGGD
ncbi:MAG TPA: AsmA family protein, partial [Stellaceae bacterium]|nr:AsmA family protein [Stellaceae bacterium]